MLLIPYIDMYSKQNCIDDQTSVKFSTLLFDFCWLLCRIKVSMEKIVGYLIQGTHSIIQCTHSKVHDALIKFVYIVLNNQINFLT